MLRVRPAGQHCGVEQLLDPQQHPKVEQLFVCLDWDCTITARHMSKTLRTPNHASASAFCEWCQQQVPPIELPGPWRSLSLLDMLFECGLSALARPSPSLHKDCHMFLP